MEPASHGSSFQGLFPRTQWSAILSGHNSTRGLHNLAHQYWRPLYLYLRKRGLGHDDASDSVQGFFEFITSSGFLQSVDRQGGKFRSYLLASLERWWSRRRVHDGAQKRGSQFIHISLDDVDEMREALSGGIGLSPQDAFDQQWATDMINHVVASLRESYENRGRGNWFEALSPALPGGNQLEPYNILAQRLGSTEGAIKKAVYDLRTSFAAKLKEEIRATVATNEDAEEELRYLVSVMSQA